MCSFRLAVRSDVNSVIDSRLLKEAQLTGSISDYIVWFVQLALSGSLVPSPNAPTLRLLVLLACMNSNWFGWLRFSDHQRFKNPSHINTLHTWLSHPFHKSGDSVFIETTGCVDTISSVTVCTCTSLCMQAGYIAWPMCGITCMVCTRTLTTCTRPCMHTCYD